MSLWAMIFLLAIAGMAFAAWSRKQDAQQGVVRDHLGNPVGQSDREIELQKEVEELRERVKVLERIATDGRDTKQLSEEIEKLRDN